MIDLKRTESGTGSRTPVVYHPGHALHKVDRGLWAGGEIETNEVPSRIEIIVSALRDQGHGISEAAEADLSILREIHDPGMVDYMERAYEEWVSAGVDVAADQELVTAYAFPTVSFMAGLPLRQPTSAAARPGQYAMDTMTRIGPGTYAGALSAITTTLGAVDLITHGHRAAYAATRPPGHHAGRDYFGGSCYLNNAAVGAQALLDAGHRRVLIVDIDAHHGNGTQQIFYERADVIYVSIHVDPSAGWFPHYMGHADEVGIGRGRLSNLNIPLTPGAGDDIWLAALDRAVEAGMEHNPESIVVSLGVDAGASDPESPLAVTRSGFHRAGTKIAAASLPVLMVQEGGYDLGALGGDVAAFLNGFDQKGSS